MTTLRAGCKSLTPDLFFFSISYSASSEEFSRSPRDTDSIFSTYALRVLSPSRIRSKKEITHEQGRQVTHIRQRSSSFDFSEFSLTNSEFDISEANQTALIPFTFEMFYEYVCSDGDNKDLDQPQNFSPKSNPNRIVIPDIRGDVYGLQRKPFAYEGEAEREPIMDNIHDVGSAVSANTKNSYIQVYGLVNPKTKDCRIEGDEHSDAHCIQKNFSTQSLLTDNRNHMSREFSSKNHKRNNERSLSSPSQTRTNIDIQGTRNKLVQSTNPSTDTEVKNKAVGEENLSLPGMHSSWACIALERDDTPNSNIGDTKPLDIGCSQVEVALEGSESIQSESLAVEHVQKIEPLKIDIQIMDSISESPECNENSYSRVSKNIANHLYTANLSRTHKFNQLWITPQEEMGWKEYRNAILSIIMPMVKNHFSS